MKVDNQATADHQQQSAAESERANRMHQAEQLLTTMGYMKNSAGVWVRADDH